MSRRGGVRCKRAPHDGGGSAWNSPTIRPICSARLPGGRRFTFADPSGNILGVYQPSE
jgi:predicted enzyme related to lactoylglutathione lyase